MKPFAEWLSTTAPSVFLQEHNTWAIPVIQSIHIVGIALVMGSVLMIDLRILGWAGTDQTLQQTSRRFGPWLTASLWLMLVTGILMVIGEPVRELVTFSFWFKMALVAIGTIIAALFRMNLRQQERQGDATRPHRASTRGLAIASLLIWFGVILLGRFIAYDHIWGAWSPAATQ